MKTTLKNAPVMYHYVPTAGGEPHLTNRDSRTPQVGKTLATHRAELCSIGLHAAPTLTDALCWCAQLGIDAPALELVRLFGNDVQHSNNKSCATRRRCDRLYTSEETRAALRAFAIIATRAIVAQYELPAILDEWIRDPGGDHRATIRTQAQDALELDRDQTITRQTENNNAIGILAAQIAAYPAVQRIQEPCLTLRGRLSELYATKRALAVRIDVIDRLEPTITHSQRGATEETAANLASELAHTYTWSMRGRGPTTEALLRTVFALEPSA